MNDERIVRLIAEYATYHGDLEFGEKVLAALRADGFDVYRPDECPWVTISDHLGTEQAADFWEIVSEKGALDGEAIFTQYRLVPVGEGTEARKEKP